MEHRAPFNRARHIQYWKRCLRSHLPTAYTHNDSNRMTLAFFILSALDLLGVLSSEVSAAERADCIAWIYHCQHPDGGFRGFPGTDFGVRRAAHNELWDPANVPATYFALASLAVLGDDFGKVRRRECLIWLRRTQRPDGSFGEQIGEKGRIEGGTDSRYGYCATGIRWMLRGTVEGSVDGVEDIRVDELVECIKRSQTYDGGISEAPFHEAHAGFTYCAIVALAFISRLPTDSSNPSHTTHQRPTGLTSLPQTLHWLLARQTATLDDDDAFDTEGDETDTAATCHDAHSFVKLHPFPSKTGEQSFKARPTGHFELDWLGFNGRSNKIADTCYAFWVSASLDILHKAHLVAVPAARRYLLDRTQHAIGGFGKLPGDPPDIYHSYLGLAALGVLQKLEPREMLLKEFEPLLCCSRGAVERLEGLEWRRKITGGKAECGGSGRWSGEMGEGKAEGKGRDGANGDMSYIAISGG